MKRTKIQIEFGGHDFPNSDRWVSATFSRSRLSQFRSVGVRDFLAFQIGGWPRLSQFRSVGVRDFLANFPTPSPHALGNGISDRLEICLAGLVESLRGWSVWPGTGPITTTTLESSTFYARRTRIVRRGFGGAELARRQDPFTAIRSADRERVTPTAVRY